VIAANTRRTERGLEPILEARDLCKDFGGLHAVSHVSLEVMPGEIVGILGPNGSGKSTLFNLLSRMLPANRGTIRFDGRDITGIPAYRCSRIGLARTFQIPSPFERMTVLENLLAVYRPEPVEQMKTRAREILAMLKLTRLSDERADSCSGGQLKLLEIGRALMTEPKLILLDECVAGVNPVLRGEIVELLQGLRAKGMTILLIEHDMEWVRALCDRLVVMHHGEIIAAGTFDEVTRNATVVDAYLGA
jgi:branched-chain amino acid transport system ATP-binding protein